MKEIRPLVLLGLGPRGRRTLEQFGDRLEQSVGKIPSILSAVIEIGGGKTVPLGDTDSGLAMFRLAPPQTGDRVELPSWASTQLASLPPEQALQTRGGIRLALHQQQERLAHFFAERLPHITGFETTTELQTIEMTLSKDRVIDLAMIVDLADPAASALFIDLAPLLDEICRRQGFEPRLQACLLLPPPTAKAEAIAYAALKELDAVLSKGRKGKQHPLTDGIYLWDMATERGYSLEMADDLPAIVAEWIYATTFLGIDRALDKHRDTRLLHRTWRRRPRAYQVVGLISRIIPRRVLVEWQAARLARNLLIALQHGKPEISPKKRSQAFVERLGLRPAALRERLWRSFYRANGAMDKVEQYRAQLRQASLVQMDRVMRRVLQRMREDLLGDLQRYLREQREALLNEVIEALAEEISNAPADAPIGGMRLAEEIISNLNIRIDELNEQIEAEETKLRNQRRQAIAFASRLSYLLEEAQLRLPAWPIAALAFLGALIAPTLYLSLLAFQRGTVPPLGVGLLVLFEGLLIAWIVYDLLRHTREMREQHVRLLEQRVELESAPLLYQAMSELYTEILREATTVSQRIGEAHSYLSKLQDWLRERERSAEQILRQMERPGPLGTLITLRDVNTFYERTAGELSQHARIITVALGPIERWKNSSPENAAEAILTYTRSHFMRIPQNTVSELMINAEWFSPFREQLKQLLEWATPLFTPDPSAFDLDRVPLLTIVASAGRSWSRLSEPLAVLQPDVIPIDSQNEDTFLIARVRYGLPLFALRRLPTMQKNYRQALLLEGDLLHTTWPRALAPDPLPAYPTKFSGATLFALGRATELITTNGEGHFIIQTEGTPPIILGHVPIQSAATLGADPEARRLVYRGIQRLISQKGPQAVGAILQEYLNFVTDLEPWEREAVQQTIRALR